MQRLTRQEDHCRAIWGPHFSKAGFSFGWRLRRWTQSMDDKPKFAFHPITKRRSSAFFSDCGTGVNVTELPQANPAKHIHRNRNIPYKQCYMLYYVNYITEPLNRKVFQHQANNYFALVVTNSFSVSLFERVWRCLKKVLNKKKMLRLKNI